MLWAFYLPHLNAAVQLPAADEIDRLLRDPAMLTWALPPALHGAPAAAQDG